MALEQALFARLSGYSGLTSLTSTRIYFMEAAAKPTAPYVVFEVDDDEEQGHAMGVDVAPRRAFCRFYCFGATSDAARAVADQLVAALRRYTGTHGDVTIQDCYIRGNRGLVDDAAKLKVRLVEFEIVY